MRGIYYLLSRYYVLIIFVLLEAFALQLVYQSHKYQEVKFVNTSNAISGRLLGYVNSFYTFINLGKNNQALVEENARLRQQLAYQPGYPGTDSLLPGQSETYRYTYIPARIVNNSINKNVNYITLDKGAKDGIVKGLGVISSNGVVGVITNVSDDFSLLMSVISIKSLVGVRHKNTNALGNLKWDGRNPFVLQVENMSKTLPIKKNDTIVTAGFSSIFPPDIVVAKVLTVKPGESTSFYEMDVMLTNNIATLSHVYIVKNKKKNQVDSLQMLMSNE